MPAEKKPCRCTIVSLSEDQLTLSDKAGAAIEYRRGKWRERGVKKEGIAAVRERKAKYQTKAANVTRTRCLDGSPSACQSKRSAGILGEPDERLPIGQGEACLYYVSPTEAIFISFDKNRRLFTSQKQDEKSDRPRCVVRKFAFRPNRLFPQAAGWCRAKFRHVRRSRRRLPRNWTPPRSIGHSDRLIISFARRRTRRGPIPWPTPHTGQPGPWRCPRQAGKVPAP